MCRCRRCASGAVCGRSPAITVEIIAQAHQLSLHSYGFASEVRRCCFNGRRVLRRGSAVASATCRCHRVWLAEGASRLAAAARSGSCASRGVVVVSLCRPPCPAQGLCTRARRSMRSFVASSMGLRITAPSRRHPTAGRTWHHVHSQPCAASHWMRLTSNVRPHCYALRVLEGLHRMRPRRIVPSRADHNRKSTVPEALAAVLVRRRARRVRGTCCRQSGGRRSDS
jgi:hypothetical protein